jgi:thiol-disulfide isomerase/thioredoxin
MSVLKKVYILLTVIALSLTVLPAVAKESYPLPEFTQTSAQEWLNSKPLTKKDLLGKVTLVDFWTFGCWNCYRSFPWLHGVEKQYKPQGFQILGIHSPEFESEKVHANIKAKLIEFKITNAVMVDNDMGYWRAMNNRYWPSYFIVDKQGQVRANFIGETHKGSAQANKIEALIGRLLVEK